MKNVAKLQKKFALRILIGVIILTVIIGIGIKDISLQTDLTKEMPQDLPVFQMNDKISDTFGGQDTIILLFQIDDRLDKRTGIDDIRHPYVMQALLLIEGLLDEESSVDGITSPAVYFKGKYFLTIDHTIAILDAESGSDMFFSKDYKSTLMYIQADVGSSEDKISDLAKLIKENLDASPSIPGVKVSITGKPPMRATLSQLLAHDAGFTLMIAAFVILLLLFVVERSITKGLLIFSPLVIGLIWTLGSMGWLNIPLSIGTVGLGAMILGLGIEYGVFMLTRYKEEREKGKDQLESLLVAVPLVGGAIFGSGMTTIIGFLALTLSTLPMMQKLGMTLALGIGFTLISAIFVAPVIFILEENFEYWHTHHKHKKLLVKKEKHARNSR
ncbi:MAG: MMPL family transporter [Nanoarchaeota archaeon]|nr:MMPL family transporter [Nanoarchaeota archaeon]